MGKNYSKLINIPDIFDGFKPGVVHSLSIKGFIKFPDGLSDYCSYLEEKYSIRIQEHNIEFLDKNRFSCKGIVIKNFDNIDELEEYLQDFIQNSKDQYKVSIIRNNIKFN